MTEPKPDTADAILTDHVVGLKREIEELRHLFAWQSNWQTRCAERIVALEDAREGGAITARDAFAASVLEGTWAANGICGYRPESYAEVARIAYEQADAMMSERARTKEEAE